MEAEAPALDSLSLLQNLYVSRGLRRGQARGPPCSEALKLKYRTLAPHANLLATGAQLCSFVVENPDLSQTTLGLNPSSATCQE